jgi:tetratricopeptide (TPR) repeat protein
VIPVLAPVGDGHAPQLDLLPNEWEMLSLIDGESDLRGIATTLARSEFDVARIAYGLVTTGVVALRQPERVSTRARLPVEDATPHLDEMEAALARGDAEAALQAARAAQAADPSSAMARLGAGRALLRMDRVEDAHDELRRAAALDPNNEEVSHQLGWAAARRGQFDEAIQRWEHFLSSHPSGAPADRVRAAIEVTRRLRALLEANAGV